MSLNTSQPEQMAPQDGQLPPGTKPRQIKDGGSKKLQTHHIALSAIVLVIIVGAGVWYLINKPATSNENPRITNQTTSTPMSTTNNDSDQMKEVLDKYLGAIQNKNLDNFKTTLDPESSDMRGSPDQLQQGFDFLSQGAEPAALGSARQANFVKTVDVHQRYNIPGLTLYLSEYPAIFNDPISGEQMNTRVNAVFFRLVGGEWKIRSFSTYNYNKTGGWAALQTGLEKFLQSVYF